MKNLVIMIIACLAGVVAAADPADEVRCREIGFSQSAEMRNAEAFRSYIDADARFVGNQVMRGVDAVATAWQVFFDDGGPTIKWRPQIIEVLDNGSLALSRGPYRTLSKDDDGNPVEHWGTYNSIWRLNDDGQWRIVFDAGSPAAGEPDETARALLDGSEDDCP